MVEALRALQDQVTGSAPPGPVLAEATRQLAELTRQLAKYPVDEHGQIAGHLAGVPGRGQALTPPIHVEQTAPGSIRARVTFGRYYLGGNGAVHGGAIPLVFDELMGRLANIGRSPARTAYLHINYRNITPIETPLTVEAHLAAEDGRKRHMRAVLARAPPCAPTPRPCSSPSAPASPDPGQRNASAHPSAPCAPASPDPGQRNASAHPSAPASPDPAQGGTPPRTRPPRPRARRQHPPPLPAQRDHAGSGLGKIAHRGR